MARFKERVFPTVGEEQREATRVRLVVLEAVGFFLIFFLIFFSITPVIFAFLESDELGFTWVEGEWSFLNSLYFTFITFSTIGFGDMVPGEC